jgi:hypothetical protein
MLLTITAALEAATGVAVAPSSVVLVLLGSQLDSPASLVIARVLGAALFSLGAACWLARDGARVGTAACLLSVDRERDGFALLDARVPQRHPLPERDY